MRLIQRMKKSLLISSILIALATSVRADFRFSINIGSPPPVVVHRPARVVACTQPVIISRPAPVWAPAPLIVAPSVACGPPLVVYGPPMLHGHAVVYRPIHRGFRHRHFDGREYAHREDFGYHR